MTEPDYIPYLKWGMYKSKNPKKPDILKVEALDPKEFQTEYSTCVLVKVDGEKVNLPLHSFNSANRQLLQLWRKAMKEGRIKKGKKFKIQTWKVPHSKKKGYEIRRYGLVF